MTEEQEGEERAMLGSAERDLTVFVEDLKRPQKREQHACSMAPPEDVSRRANLRLLEPGDRFWVRRGIRPRELTAAWANRFRALVDPLSATQELANVAASVPSRPRRRARAARPGAGCAVGLTLGEGHAPALSVCHVRRLGLVECGRPTREEVECLIGLRAGFGGVDEQHQACIGG
jgi:hypothetical protein